MSAARLSLPATLEAWRSVLAKALALPAAEVHVPPQFSITHGKSGSFLTSFGQPVTAKKNPRTSGVISVLMPLPSTPAGQQASAGTGASPLTEAERLRELASRISGGGMIRPAGQQQWPDGSYDEAALGRPYLAPLPYDGLDLVIPVTLRTGSLRAHSAQVSLPGGRCDEGETPQVAARREAVEEVGIDAARIDMLGETSRLYSFPSQAFVHPCVGIADAFLDTHVASPDEVQSIHFLSLGALVADSRFHQRLAKSWSETGPVNMPCFRTSDGVVVWGLTAFAIGELVSRVGTVLGSTPRLPSGVLEAWGDGKLSKVLRVRFQNPYADAMKQPLTKRDRDGPKAPQEESSRLKPSFAAPDSKL